MHRFGRSSDQRWKDRWGGGFVIITVLALAGAWYLGNYLSDKWAAGGPEATMETATHDTLNPAGTGNAGPAAGGAMNVGAADLAGYPKPMTVYYLQAHAFKTREQAASAAKDLNAYGVPAAVSASDGWFKVIIGAYGSKNAAEQAKMSAEANYKGKGKLAVLARSVSVAGQPGLQPANPKALAAYQNGIAALSGYLHAASAWWDAYAAGQPQAADHLTIYTNQLRIAMDQLKDHEADAAVNRFLSLASQAMANGTQITAAASAMGTAPAAAQGAGASPARADGSQIQAAMEGYVTLLDDYRNWTAPARQP